MKNSLNRKNNYKLISIITMLLIIISTISNVSYATTRRLDVIKTSSETKKLENNQGEISKTIINSNKDTGEVTIEIKLANTKEQTEEVLDTEIFLVIDNSPSMDFMTSNGKTRKEIVIESTKTLVESIFNNSQKVKIGIVDFHGPNGWLDSAGIGNAKLRKNLTDKKDEILTELDKLNNASTVSGTNIDAGLQRAEQNFTETCENKVIVLLTDGLPNADVKGNSSGNTPTTEEARTVQATTKETLIRLGQEGYNIISLMTGMSESDGNTDKNGNVYEGYSTLEEDLAAVERVFGTTGNPTAGKYYLVKATDINSIVNNDILNDVMATIQNPMKEVKIVDYFPNDIENNFEFSYISNPNYGTTTERIENGMITWDIGTLKDNEIASLKYKLKIKDLNNSEIVNKVISTNEKIVLTYKDSEDRDFSVTLSTSPQIKLVEIQDLTATVSYNPTSNTEGTVVATITANKEVQPVDGWNLSPDKKSMTKTYTTNKTEVVKVKDYDGQEKDVTVTINNIVTPKQTPVQTQKPSQPEEDDTISKKQIPYAGISYTVIIAVIILIISGIIGYKKYNDYKDI